MKPEDVRNILYVEDNVGRQNRLRRWKETHCPQAELLVFGGRNELDEELARGGADVQLVLLDSQIGGCDRVLDTYVPLLRGHQRFARAVIFAVTDAPDTRFLMPPWIQGHLSPMDINEDLKDAIEQHNLLTDEQLREINARLLPADFLKEFREKMIQEVLMPLQVYAWQKENPSAGIEPVPFPDVQSLVGALGAKLRDAGEKGLAAGLGKACAECLTRAEALWKEFPGGELNEGNLAAFYKVMEAVRDRLQDEDVLEVAAC